MMGIMIGVDVGGDDYYYEADDGGDSDYDDDRKEDVDRDNDNTNDGTHDKGRFTSKMSISLPYIRQM